MYVAASERGSGVGRALGQALVEASERAGIWTLEGWIFPENEASLALCESFGCRVVGVRERLGKMGDRWRDVLLVERRSASRPGAADLQSATEGRHGMRKFAAT